MRVKDSIDEDAKECWGWFGGDTPDGGTDVECDRCHCLTNTKEQEGKEELFCKNCGIELIYASWWSW